MKKSSLTSIQITYIQENYQSHSQKDMALHLGIDRGIVGRFMKKHNLSVTKAQSREFTASKLRGKTSFTKDEDDFIAANYLTTPVKRIATILGKSGCGVNNRLKAMNLVIPKDIIEARKQDSYLKKGNIPFSKGKKQTEFMSAESIERTKATRFQKGNLPHNYRPVDSTRLTKDGYLMVKVKEPRTWRLKQRVVFENHYGVTLKSGQNVVFLDEIKQILIQLI